MLIRQLSGLRTGIKYVNVLDSNNPAVKKRILIVGGGVAGLSAAYFLSGAGYQITLFEKASSWGGADAALHWNGISIERHYHHYFTQDSEVLNLIKDLGLSEYLTWRNGTSAVYYQGKIYSLSLGKFLLQFTPLSVWKRFWFALRMLQVALGPRPTKFSSNASRETSVTWAQRFFGTAITRVIWEPLLKAKFGSSFNDISAHFLRGRIFNRVTSRRTGEAKEKLGYLLGSSQRFIDALLKKLQVSEAETHLKTGVSALKFSDDGAAEGAWDEHGIYHPADAVILAVQTPVASNLLSQSRRPSLLDGEMEKLGRIKYQQVVSVILFCRKKILDVYWVNVVDESSPFPVMVEHTQFIPPELYQGTHVLYLASYRDPGDSLLTMKDDGIYDYFVKHLKRIQPHFDERDVLGYAVGREPYATPIFVRQFESSMIPIQSQVPNLYYLNGTQVFPDSRNVNKMVQLASQCAQMITRKM